MLQHFSYKPMFDNKQLPGWTFAFFFRNTRYTGEYLPDGTLFGLEKRRLKKKI